MKYIVFQLKSEDRQTLHMPVLFPDVVNHKDMADVVEHVRVMPGGPMTDWWMWPKPVSAGFIMGGVCHGRSDSLNMASHPDDTMIIDACNKGAQCAEGFRERANV